MSPFVGHDRLFDRVGLVAVVPARSEGAVSASEFNLFGVRFSDQRVIVERGRVGGIALAQLDVGGGAVVVGPGDMGDVGQLQSDDVDGPVADDDVMMPDVSVGLLLHESGTYSDGHCGSSSNAGDGPPDSPGHVISPHVEARVSSRLTWSFVLKNLDRHAHGAASGERWFDIGAAIDGHKNVEGVVLCEVCLPDGGSPPHVPHGWKFFVASRSDRSAGTLSGYRVSRKPHLLEKIVNGRMEMNVVVIYEGRWPMIVFGGYILPDTCVKDLEECVNAPLNDLMSRIKGGVLRCAPRPTESLADAPIMMACDFNARFGAVDTCVPGSDGFDVAGDLPMGGIPWKSVDAELNSRGRFWWQFFRRWGLRLCNDLEVLDGVRGAVFTNHTERGNAMVDGIAVEVASGLWPAIVNVHVGAPIERGRVPPTSTYFWEQLAAVKYHEPVCVTFERRVAPVRAVKRLGDGVFKLHAERVTQNQWRDFGGAVDRHFEALPPGQGVGSPNIWGSIVASMRAATSELQPSVPLPPVFRPSAEEKRELRDLRAVQRGMRTMQSLGRARGAYCAAHERLRVLKRNQQRRADLRGHLRGLRANEDAQRDRRVHQRLFAKQLKRVANDDKIPAAAAVELLNELGLLTADPDEHVRLWSNQYERVGKAHPRVCEEFTTYAFDEYEPGLAAAQAAMGNGDRGPAQQRRQFTIDQLTMVCLKLKLGKSACRDGFYTDFWHKVAVRLIGESSGRVWCKDRTIMHAMLAAVNATFSGEILPPGHWAMQAIAPVLKPHLLGRVAGDFRDVTLTSNEEKLYARMLEMRLREIVEELGILDSAQHGFRKGLSCDTALWQLMSVIERQALVRRGKLFLVFWDVQKAFPTTWRARLIAKLQENGIVGDLLTAILRSGALNYVRYVRVKGATGDRLIVDERGLSTGHVLSPLLYLIESNDMPAFLRECDIEGVGVDVCGSKLASGHFADDGVGIATTATGMHHLLRRLEGYMDDARRKFNVENKATVIMCFNVAKKELVSLNFQLSGKNVTIVDEFKYLGTTISNNMSYRGTKTGHPPTLSQVTNDAMMRRVEALLGPFYTTLHAREYGVRVLRQLITEACSAAEFGSGVMVRAPWVALERRVKELVSRALRIPRSQRGVPAETLLGELGLMSFDARASMHTLRVWDAIMARPADALPRLAWLELVNACNALPGGPPKYSLVARVKEVLESVGGSVWFTSGLPRDDHSDTGYRRRCSPKELLHNREADRWRTAVQTKPMLRSYLCVRSYDLRYQEYLEHPDWQVNLARWRLRTGICCLAEAKGRWSGIAVSGRTCECPGCDKAHEVESVRHFLLVCSHWSAEREMLMSNVLLSDISLSMKACLGSIDANPDMWLRLMLGGPMHEMGVEYTEAIAVLLKRISSRMWDCDVSDIAVDRARQAVRDRTTLHWVTGRHIKNWYLQRAVLAGYDRV